MPRNRELLSLYARRRRLILGLADFDRRAARYRKTLAEVEAELLTRVLFVPLFTQRRPSLVPSRAVLTFLRQALAPCTAREITAWVMAERGLPASDPKEIRWARKSVRTALRSLHKRGMVRLHREVGSHQRWTLGRP